MPGEEPAHHHAAPSRWPQFLFARDDAVAFDKRANEPARILIVEDDYLVGSDMETTLSAAGFDVVAIAATAEEAVALAASEKPILILMDIRLAGQRDGIDAALEIFRSYGIRSIFATAHQDEHARTRAEPAKPLSWLSKPFTMASLVDTVRQGLRALYES
jgi:DNA-binding NarL/FixJ family response regulator